MEWSDSLAFGVQIIDDQHKEIIKRVNSVISLLENAQAEMPEVDKLLDFLADYVISHFAMEESLQRESDYPEYEHHRAQHAEFVNSFLKMQFSFLHSGYTPDTLGTLKSVVVNWLVHHIGESDSVFAAHYIQFQTRLQTQNV